MDTDPIGQVAVVRADIGDMPRVRALARLIWPEAYGDIIAPDRISPMVEEIYAPQTLRADIEQGHVFWLATADGMDAGYASAYLEAGRLWIKKLYVRDACRGRGIGKALMQAAFDRFGGAGRVSLYVNDGNGRAIAFYRSQGFEIEDKVPVRMGPYDFEDYIMTKPL